MIELEIDPVAKPRMTRSDKWAHRPVVDRYFAFKDALVLLCKKQKYFLPDKYGVRFYIAMPESWSAWRKIDMKGKPHQQKPDLDNLLKSINDCLKVSDQTIYALEASKYWDDEGRIVFYEIA